MGILRVREPRSRTNSVLAESPRRFRRREGYTTRPPQQYADWLPVQELGNECQEAYSADGQLIGRFEYARVRAETWLLMELESTRGDPTDVLTTERVLTLYALREGQLVLASEHVVLRRVVRHVVDAECFEEGMDEGYGDSQSYHICNDGGTVTESWEARGVVSDGALHVSAVSGDVPAEALGTFPLAEPSSRSGG